jgi:hypothetical protein
LWPSRTVATWIAVKTPLMTLPVSASKVPLVGKKDRLSLFSRPEHQHPTLD